jgi:hypothetical protein
MHRLIARLLLLFALAGNLFPLAMATVPAATHACCIRKAHQCHDSLSSGAAQPAVRDANCCDHHCCHAATTAHWGHPASEAKHFRAAAIERFVKDAHSILPGARVANSHSSRAPPESSIA